MILGKSKYAKEKTEQAKREARRKYWASCLKAKLLKRPFAWYPRKMACGRWIWLQRYKPRVVVLHLNTGWFRETFLPGDTEFLEKAISPAVAKIDRLTHESRLMLYTETYAFAAA